MRLDDLDMQIVASLVADARESFAEIGRRIGLSAPAVKRRVDRLCDEGVITGFTAIVDLESDTPTTDAFVELFCRGGTAPEEIAALARANPRVVAAYTVTGDADALLRLRTRTVAELDDAVERIRSDARVERTRSSVVLGELFERVNSS